MIPADIEPLVSFIGNDTASVFPFEFSTFESDNVRARVLDSVGVYTELTIAVDFTLDGIGKLQGGGSLTLVDAGQAWINGGNLKTGYTLFIDYNPVPKQLAKFRDLGRHTPAAFERALDRLTMDVIALVGSDSSLAEAADFLRDGYTPVGPQTIGAGGTITVRKLKRQHIRVTSDGGEKALSVNPFGADTSLFEDGMEIVLEPTEGLNFLTIAESDTDYGYIGNGGIELKKGNLITFIYSAFAKRFYVKSFGAW